MLIDQSAVNTFSVAVVVIALVFGNFAVIHMHPASCQAYPLVKSSEYLCVAGELVEFMYKLVTKELQTRGVIKPSWQWSKVSEILSFKNNLHPEFQKEHDFALKTQTHVRLTLQFCGCGFVWLTQRLCLRRFT